MKKILCLILTVAILISTNLSVYATTDKTEINANIYDDYVFTNQDVYQLDKYISVNSENIFIFDVKLAKFEGVDPELIKMQLAHLEKLNSMAKAKVINIKSKYEIDVVKDEAYNYTVDTRIDFDINDFTSSRAGHAYNCGGGINTAVEFHWWGYSRYACDCESNRIAADLNSAAAVGAGVSAIAAFFGGAPVALVAGVDAAYWWYVASRIDANNRGHGIYMGMTYLLIFNIDPQ